VSIEAHAHPAEFAMAQRVFILGPFVDLTLRVDSKNNQGLKAAEKPLLSLSLSLSLSLRKEDQPSIAIAG
jgi:hypothetical protein